MESLKEQIKQFLSIDVGCDYGDGSGDGNGDGYGYGYGDGYGSGHGDGSGDGNGDGDGYGGGYGYGCGSGHGDGSGDGNGYGYGNGGGYGYGIKELDGDTIYMIDNTPTFIDSVHGNYAKGRILQTDLTTKDCFIAKMYGRYFAHGETLKQAFNDAMNKSFQDIPEDERIARFKEQYPDNNVKISAKELFDWHSRLTGSCEMGRSNFVRNHGIDLDSDSFTVREFVELTKNDYGGDIICKILKS